MHVPDHFLAPEISIVTGAAAAVVVVAALRVGRPRVKTSAVVLAGATAAVVFGAQMANFPVLSGTSGHLIGAALAVALVGPRLALLVMAGVLAVQSLAFGDGGVTALGTNVLVMGVVPILAAHGFRRLAERVRLARFVRTTAAVSALASVPAGALALTALYAVGGSGTVDVAAMAGSMTAVHLLIGVGEAVITVAVLSLVLTVAPGVAHADARPVGVSAPRRGILALGASSVLFATALASLAASTPDGLESVALAYDLPVGETIVAGIPLLSAYGSAASTSVAAVGLLGILAAAAVAAALASPTLRRGTAA